MVIQCSKQTYINIKFCQINANLQRQPNLAAILYTELWCCGTKWQLNMTIIDRYSAKSAWNDNLIMETLKWQFSDGHRSKHCQAITLWRGKNPTIMTTKSSNSKGAIMEQWSFEGECIFWGQQKRLAVVGSGVPLSIPMFLQLLWLDWKRRGEYEKKMRRKWEKVAFDSSTAKTQLPISFPPSDQVSSRLQRNSMATLFHSIFQNDIFGGNSA